MHWLAEQGLAPKRAFLAGISLLNYIVIEIIRNRGKGKNPMKKNALDALNVSIKVISNLCGNLAGGALLANVLFDNRDLRGR